MFKENKNKELELTKYISIVDMSYPSSLSHWLSAEDLIWDMNSENFQDTATKLINLMEHKHVQKKFIEYIAERANDCRNQENEFLELQKMLKFTLPYKPTNEFFIRLQDTFKKDDVDEFQKIANNNNSQTNYLSTRYLNLSAEYGAVNIYKYISLNNVQPEADYTVRAAVKGGNYEIIQILNNNGFDFSTALKVAIKYHHNSIADWIISNFGCSKINPYKCVEFGNLHAAVFYIENGIKSKYKLPIAAAKIFCQPFFEYITAKGFNVNIEYVFGQAAHLNDYHLMHFLIKNGFKLSKSFAENLLLNVCSQGLFEAAKALISIGTNVNCNSGRFGEGYKTPLYYANKSNNVELARYLIEKGALR